MKAYHPINHTDPSYNFSVIPPSHPKYAVLQQNVMERYALSYEADVLPRPDVFALLKQLASEEDTWGASFGITSAKNKPLFSEQYIDLPVEKLIAERHGKTLDRSKIAEVGAVISHRSPGSGKKLLQMMPWLLWSMDFEFILMTGTSHVRNILKSARIPFFPLVNAKAERLNADPARWGSYYESQPVTGLIDIKSALYPQMLDHYAKKFTLDNVDIQYTSSTHFLFKGENHETTRARL